jgi:hypothetical protein
MGVMNAFRIYVRILARKDIKMAVKEIGCEDVYWIYRLRVWSGSGIL